MGLVRRGTARGGGVGRVLETGLVLEQQEEACAVGYTDGQALQLALESEVAREGEVLEVKHPRSVEAGEGLHDPRQLGQRGSREQCGAVDVAIEFFAGHGGEGYQSATVAL